MGRLARFLETVRADDPDNPFWKGVREIVPADSYVDLEMFEPLAPRQLGVGTSQVECHLFDDDALEEGWSGGDASIERDIRSVTRRRPPATGPLVCREGNQDLERESDSPFVPAGGLLDAAIFPLAFVGTFLVALLALLALLFPVIERITQLSTE